MAQHDGVIDNQAGAATRSDLNNALAALISNNSGATAPPTTYAYQPWADTTTGLLKIRNAANSAWITIGTLADAYLGLASLGASSLFTGATNTFNGAVNYAATSGTDTYAASISPALISYVIGAHYFISFGTANTVTTPTLNLNALGAKTIVKNGTAALAIGDIPAGHKAVLMYDGTYLVLLNPMAVAANAEAYIYIRDEKAATTEGGTFTSGAWRTRTLNTEVADTGNNATLATNQITLAAGTYRFRADAPAYDVNTHQAKLYNITDVADIALGTSERSGDAANTVTRSFVAGRFTIAGSKVLELQHRCVTTFADSGFGRAVGWATEVYAQIEFWKEA
mgnify:CR=1 FL=1